jgi:hypothetical protein
VQTRDRQVKLLPGWEHDVARTFLPSHYSGSAKMVS